MKRFIIAVLAASFLCMPVFTFAAEKESLNLGTLSYLGTTEAKFQEGLDALRNESSVVDDEFLNQLAKTRRVIHFHDSLMSLLMNLKSGRLDEIILPGAVAKYVIGSAKSHEVEFSTNILSSGISFGFRSDNQELKQEIDSMINAMREDGTLQVLERKYITNYDSKARYPSIIPEKFKDAPEIRVAVTGDMPPIDMFASDGRPAGYNTAVLAEIGRRLKKNIRLINVTSAARSETLSSGRADIVFWYRSSKSDIKGYDVFSKLFNDVNDGVILSVPYFYWKREDVLVIKAKKSFLGLF